MRRAVLLVASIAVLCLPATASARRRRGSHRNPACEVTAVASVEEAPRRTKHGNGRSFEEFTVRLLSTEPAAPPSGSFSFDRDRPVRVVHDLSCGGAWLDLKPGDRVELRGEYVHTPKGPDVLHFTHPAGAVPGCGTGAHVDGYLRLRREAASLEPARPASPAARPASESGSTWPPPAPIAAASATGTESELPPSLVASFREKLRPILSTRCAPCHEPGGKMHGRLPFDDPKTVAANAGRMATRLKGDDLKALQAWTAEASPPR